MLQTRRKSITVSRSQPLERVEGWDHLRAVDRSPPTITSNGPDDAARLSIWSSSHVSGTRRRCTCGFSIGRRVALDSGTTVGRSLNTTGDGRCCGSGANNARAAPRSSSRPMMRRQAFAEDVRREHDALIRSTRARASGSL